MSGGGRDALLDRPCVYKRGGTCKTHGRGAIRKWKPVLEEVVDNEGRVTMQYLGKKRTYYVCDLDPRKGGKLRQSKLSFQLKTTPKDSHNREDTMGGPLQ